MVQGNDTFMTKLYPLYSITSSNVHFLKISRNCWRYRILVKNCLRLTSRQQPQTTVKLRKQTTIIHKSALTSITSPTHEESNLCIYLKHSLLPIRVVSLKTVPLRSQSLYVRLSSVNNAIYADQQNIQTPARTGKYAELHDYLWNKY